MDGPGTGEEVGGHGFRGLLHDGLREIPERVNRVGLAVLLIGEEPGFLRIHDREAFEVSGRWRGKAEFVLDEGE